MTPAANESVGAARHCSHRRRAAGRRAAVAVLAGLAAFFALQFAGSAVVQCRFPEALDPVYAGRLARLRKAFEARPAPQRLVVMVGTSRAYVGLDEIGLKESLSRRLKRPICVDNFAVLGAGPLDELLSWRALRRSGVRPDLLLVEVLPAYLTDDITLLEAARIPAGQVNWLDLPLFQRYGGVRPHLRRDAVGAELAAWYGRRSGILRAAAPELLPRDASPNPIFITDPARAFIPDGMSPEARARARARALQDPGCRLSHIRIGSKGCQAYRELLASCRAEGVHAAVVVMPEGPAFRGIYPEGTWGKVSGWLEEVCREQDAGLVNAEEWLDEDDFFDSHHPLAHGARKFTERLDREYVGPRLQGMSAGANERRAP